MAVLAAGAAVLAVTNLYMALDSEEVAAWVAPRVSERLNRPVAFREAGLALWPSPALRMRDVEVGNLEGFQGPVLARIASVRLDISWLPLVVGRVRIERLELEDVQLHLAVDLEGRTNFGDLLPSASERTRQLPAAVALAIREISLSNGSFTFFDAHADHSLAVSGIDAQALVTPEAEGWRSTVAARSDSLLVRFAGADGTVLRGAGPGAVMAAHGGDDVGSVTIDEGVLTLAQDTVTVYGSVALAGETSGFDLLLADESLSARVLEAIFPPDVRAELLPHAEGSMRLMVQLLGGGGTPPSLRGSLRLQDVGLRLRGEPVLERVRGAVAITPDTMWLDSLTGRFAGGPFELSGTLARNGGASALLARGTPRLETLERLDLLPEGTAITGVARVDLSVVGPLASPDSVEVVGTAQISDFALRHPRLAVPLRVPSADISLVGREVRWASVPVLVGDDSLLTSATVRDPLSLRPHAVRHAFLEVSVQSPRVDLRQALVEPDSVSDATYAQIALAHLGGRQIEGRAASEVASARGLARPRGLPFDGTVDLALDTLVLRQLTVADLAGRIELADSTLVVHELAFDAWGGRAAASLLLGLGSGAAEPFALTLGVEEARAEELLPVLTPFGESVSGTLDLGLDVRGATHPTLLPVGEGLEGGVEVRLADGEVGGTPVNLALADFLADEAWTDVPFQDWTLDLRLQDRLVEVREWSLGGEAGEMDAHGTLRLDGSADLALALTIPPDRLAGISLRKTGIGQSVLERLRAAGGSLDLGLRLSGWLQAPTLEPDASQGVAGAP